MFMKKIVYLSLLFFASIAAFSQSGEETQVMLKKADSAVLQKVRLDFSVPDIPAFKSLGVDPSSMLRPSAAKDFSLMLNSFKGGPSIVPQDLAVEVAPALLITPWYTLQEYREKGGLRLLTKTRISLGSSDNEKTGVNRMAAGLRTTLFDHGDFRLDEAFLKENIYSKMELLQGGLSDRLQQVIIQMGGPVIFASLPPARQQKIRDSIFKAVQADAGFMLDTIVKNSIAKYKKESWNASRMDFAYALLLQSPDTLIGHIKLNKHSFWTTLALKPGAHNNWAQILLGVNNTIYKISDSWRNAFTGNFRFCAGTNKFKGLLEVQYQSKNNVLFPDRSNLFTQLGVEASFFNGTWLQFSTGVLNALQGVRFSALRNNLNIAISFPENFRLF